MIFQSQNNGNTMETFGQNEQNNVSPQITKWHSDDILGLQIYKLTNLANNGMSYSIFDQNNILLYVNFLKENKT